APAKKSHIKEWDPISLPLVHSISPQMPSGQGKKQGGLNLQVGRIQNRLLRFWAYCTYHAYTYWKQVQCNPSYPIDFGDERHGTSGRWDAFQVKDPRLPENEEGQPLLPQHMMHEEEEATPAPAYGTAEHNRYGPDAQEMADMEP
ncbi:unnamed protein product, partial [Effrenium voratum]